MKILRDNATRAFRRGPFQVKRMRPGAILGVGTDPAFGPLSVIDHANLDVGTVVSMHEHNNDEILSYMWRGTMVHEDSAGHRIPISSSKLMMMNAGESFWHEESTPDVPVEMLQIFIRPHTADLPGRVQFYDPPQKLPDGEWHLIAGPESSNAPLKIRQRVFVSDAHLEKSSQLRVPGVEGMNPWLYVMDGAVTLGKARLGKGDAATDFAAAARISAETETTLVLFLVDRSAPASKAGTISGQ